MLPLLDAVVVCSTAAYRIAFELQHERAPDAVEAAHSAMEVARITDRIVGNRHEDTPMTVADLKRLFINMLQMSLTLMGE